VERGLLSGTKSGKGANGCKRCVDTVPALRSARSQEAPVEAVG